VMPGAEAAQHRVEQGQSLGAGWPP
jgi:hypothetical protein